MADANTGTDTITRTCTYMGWNLYTEYVYTSNRMQVWSLVESLSSLPHQTTSYSGDKLQIRVIVPHKTDWSPQAEEAEEVVANNKT